MTISKVRFAGLVLAAGALLVAAACESSSTSPSGAATFDAATGTFDGS